MRPRRTKTTSPSSDHIPGSKSQPNRIAESTASYMGQPGRSGFGGMISGEQAYRFGAVTQLGSQPERRHQAMDRIEAAWKKILDRAEADELEEMASRAEAVLNSGRLSPEQASLVFALSEGRTYTPAQQVSLEMENQEQIFQQRREILKDSLTTAQVAALLGTSRQTPHDRVNSGALLAVSEQGRLLFPKWQFDPEGPNGVLTGLPQVLRELDISPLSKARWLTRPNATLDGRTPADALKHGDFQRVLDMARAVGVS